MLSQTSPYGLSLRCLAMAYVGWILVMIQAMAKTREDKRALS